MTDSVCEIFDVLAWVAGGLFVGLTVLGGYNFYREYQRPSVPALSLTPLQEEEIEPEQQKKTFRPIDQFHLVQKHSPEESTEEQESPEKEEPPENPSSQDLPPTKELPVTNLPYQLVGTTTGAPQYNTASVRRRKENTTRIVTTGDRWNNFTVRSIAENHIVIQNQRTGQRERMLLSGESKK
jgi:hypothetical protein